MNDAWVALTICVPVWIAAVALDGVGLTGWQALVLCVALAALAVAMETWTWWSMRRLSKDVAELKAWRGRMELRDA